MTYQITSAIVGIIIACGIFYLVRHDYLRTGYALWWLITALAIVCLALWPKFIDHLGWKLGISYPPVLVIIAGIGFILVKMLTMDIDRSRQERKVRRLVQRLAILEADQKKDLPFPAQGGGDKLGKR